MDYWIQRSLRLKKSGFDKSDKTLDELREIFHHTKQRLERDINDWYARFARNNNISLHEAKKILDKRELKDFKMSLKEYIEEAKKEDMSEEHQRMLENASIRERLSRDEALYMKLVHYGELLATKQNVKLEDLLQDIYESNSYQNAHMVQSMQGDGYSRVRALPKEEIDLIIKQPWTNDGKEFSSRIWDNKQKLVSTMKTEFVHALMQGDGTTKMAERLSKRMDVAFSDARRLVETEVAHVQELASLNTYKQYDVEEYKIIAKLDSKTSDICRHMDDSVVRVKDAEVGVTMPPFHCYCRSTTIPYFDDLKSDEEDEMDYEKWYNEYVKEPEEEAYENSLSSIEEEKAYGSLGFKAAKSIDEANEYAMKELGIPRADYKGCDIDTANEWNRGLMDTFSRFPELRKNFKFVGECHEKNKIFDEVGKSRIFKLLKEENPNVIDEVLAAKAEKLFISIRRKLAVHKNTMALSTNYWEVAPEMQGITVNRDIGKDYVEFTKSLKYQVNLKFHPNGCDTVRSVLDHEVGHQLDDLLGIRKLKHIQNLFDSREKQEITDDLSEYAWNNTSKDRYAEMIAEAWAEYCNSPAPREIARVVGDTIVGEYKRKFGGKKQ